VISTQVLAEFAAILLHEISPPANADAVMKGLDAMAAIRLVIPDAELIRRAVQVRASYGIHFYDGMIVAAAERGGCGRIWSEDFNAGQKYFGITVANPFP
jgi:predicted nucleic acid-binding protein